MRGQRWISAIIAMTTLAITAGCYWSRAHDCETGAGLDEYLGPRYSDPKVFVNDWTLTGGGMAGGGSHTEYHTSTSQGMAPYNAQTHSWGPAPTITTTTGTQVSNPGGTYVEHSVELKPFVEKKMRENGFTITDSKLLADYSVVSNGSVEAEYHSTGWLIWDLVMLCPSVLAPIPLGAVTHEGVTVTVYDNKDHLVGSRHVVYEKRDYFLSFWGWTQSDTQVHKHEEHTRMAANTASAIIADDIHLSGDLVRIKALLKDDPNFVSRKGTNDDMPLHWAAQKGRGDVVELLLNNKADVNAKNKAGQTPLHLAALNEDRPMMDLLRQHGGHD
jgi:hypothetical protein